MTDHETVLRRPVWFCISNNMISPTSDTSCTSVKYRYKMYLYTCNMNIDWPTVQWPPDWPTNQWTNNLSLKYCLAFIPFFICTFKTYKKSCIFKGTQNTPTIFKSQVGWSWNLMNFIILGKFRKTPIKHFFKFWVNSKENKTALS